MNKILSIAFIFTFLLSAYSTETDIFDYSKSEKIISEQAGAWTSESTYFFFFFEDGTVLYINMGQASVGRWKYLNKDQNIITYTMRVEKNFKGGWIAKIKGDELIEYHGDYENTYTRLKIPKMYQPNQKLEPTVKTPVE